MSFQSRGRSRWSAHQYFLLIYCGSLVSMRFSASAILFFVSSKFVRACSQTTLFSFLSLAMGSNGRLSPQHDVSLCTRFGLINFHAPQWFSHLILNSHGHAAIRELTWKATKQFVSRDSPNWGDRPVWVHHAGSGASLRHEPHRWCQIPSPLPSYHQRCQLQHWPAWPSSVQPHQQTNLSESACKSLHH